MTQDLRKLGSRLRPPGDVNPRPEPVLDFPDREYGSLTEADYRELGFLGGLEVHQQLATGTKLFCRCPSGVYVDGYDAEVLRHMRPTLSELGEYDGTALMEFKTRKEIIYRLDRGTVCTYEIDDTPPFEINRDAVRISLEIAELFSMHPVSELHVMRKQYLDGSIPAGFQRTAMIALGGEIPFRVPELDVDRALRIRQLSLEEDSCREVSDVGHRITFRTDRLGIPLTEVVTEPELLSPLELQAGARLIASTTRACPRVRRGHGAARQDVNVSIAGGRRIEIKGVSNHRGLPRLVHNEAFRQLNLLRIRAEILRRGIDPVAFEIPAAGSVLDASGLVVDATTLLRRSDYAPLRDAVDSGGRAFAIRLPGFAGLLVHRTQPGVSFASEFVDRVRVIACLVGRPFLVHSDIPGYGLRAAEWKQLRNALSATLDDATIVVFGPPRDCDTAAREILIRAREAFTGIPAETRQAMPDGTTGFERILPGVDRMYPDTDTPPLPIADEWLEDARRNRPERPSERADRYRALGLDGYAAERLSRAPWWPLFDALEPGPAAVVVEAALQRILGDRIRRNLPLPDAARLSVWVEAIREGWLLPEAVRPALRRLVDEQGVSAADALARYRVPRREGHLDRMIEELGEEIAELHNPAVESRVRWAMGRLRREWLGYHRAADVRARLHDRLARAEVGR